MRWRLAPPPPDEVRERFPEYPASVVQMLWNRGLATQEAVDEFLLPDYGHDLHDPFLFRDMRRACERVWLAIEAGERIVVYTDYDADGVTGAAVLVTALQALAKGLGRDSATIDKYIPHREKEGYGVKREAVEALAAAGMNLLITVDCGIGSAAEIVRARELGVEAIVVDHHQVPEKLPDCLILHPLVRGETYPFKCLAAVGVAYKFAVGLMRFAEERGLKFETGFDKWLLDLVAIATVTDFMPLIGENRTLEKYGLVVLNKTRRPGLKKIIELASLKPGAIDTVAVGYYIGPRINAASRMDHADVAFATVMAATDEEADELAHRLERLNSDRQKYSDEITLAARADVTAVGPRRIHLLAGDGWSPGIVGLIAGKLVTETGVPVFVFGRDGDRYVGSGRSIPEFDVMAALEKVKPFVAHYGGHRQACGLTIEGEANYLGFRDAMTAYADETLAGQDLRPTLEIEGEIQPEEINWELIDWLSRFEPYGEGNRRPRFLLPGLKLSGADFVGREGKHARLTVRDANGKTRRLIGFGLAAPAAELKMGDLVDAVVEIGVNEWNGSREIQLKAVDFHLAETSRAAASSKERQLAEKTI